MMPQDFRIVSRPVAIELDCPHCEIGISVPWGDADAPDYWGDPWNPVECPACGELIELGDYEYD